MELKHRLPNVLHIFSRITITPESVLNPKAGQYWRCSMPKMHYTPAEFDAFALDDLMRDMQHVINQAANGPYFPEIGITQESLRQYAEECRVRIERYSNGGAHAAVLRG